MINWALLPFRILSASLLLIMAGIVSYLLWRDRNGKDRLRYFTYVTILVWMLIEIGFQVYDVFHWEGP